MPSPTNRAVVRKVLKSGEISSSDEPIIYSHSIYFRDMT